MKIKRCENGHYYDEEMYVVCPHCGVLPPAPDAIPDSILPAGIIKGDQENSHSLPPIQTETVVSTHTHVQPDSVTPLEHTSLPNIIISDDSEDSHDTVEQELLGDKSTESIETEDAYANSEVTINERPVTVEEKDEKPPSIVLSSKIRFITPESDSSIEDIVTKTDDTQEPFVGWLVCLTDITMPEYRIFAGENYIVRNEGSFKLLHSLDNISLSNLLSLIRFDISSCEFEIEPFTENNIVKINGREHRRTTRIVSYDTIDVGGCSYIFVALCGKEFIWEQLRQDQGANT